MSDKQKILEPFAINLRTMMKRWEFSNRKIAEHLGMNGSNIDTLRRGITQPSVPIILKLEAMTGINARKLFEEDIDYNDYPLQPNLSALMAAEPDPPYHVKGTLEELPFKDIIKHVENLTRDLTELRKDFDQHFKPSN